MLTNIKIFLIYYFFMVLKGNQDLFENFNKSTKTINNLKRKNRTGNAKMKNLLNSLQDLKINPDKNFFKENKIEIINGKIIKKENNSPQQKMKNFKNPDDLMNQLQIHNKNIKKAKDEQDIFNIIEKPIKKKIKKTRNVQNLFDLKEIMIDKNDNFDFFGKKGKRIKNKEISDYERYKNKPIESEYEQEHYAFNKKQNVVNNKNEINQDSKLFEQINKGERENSGNLDLNSDFRPIEIIYDLKFLKTELSRIGKSNLFNDFKQLLLRCDMIFKRYLKISKKVKQKISIPKNFLGCEAANSGKNVFNFNRNNFKKETSYSSDLVILVSAYTDKNSNVIASALPCLKADDSNRAIIGRINFNIANMSLDLQDQFSYNTSLHTTIHELFHVLAFHSSIQSNFEKRVNDKNPHLLKLAEFYKKKKREYPILNSAHWNPLYLQNDIMVPTSKADSVLSIFSLEYVDLASSDLTTDMNKISNNNLMDFILKDDFWNYKCPDENSKQKAKFSYLCSMWEFRNDSFGCSGDFQSKTSCSQTLNPSNNCLEKFVVTNGDCRNTKSQKNFTFENFGENSRCFQLKPKFGNVCLNFKIVNQEIHLEIQNQVLVCKNGIKEIGFNYTNKGQVYVDTIRCPDFKDFKKQLDHTSCPYNCNFNGNCIKGICDCYGGWDPRDNCASRLPNSSTYTTYFIGS